MPKPNIYERLMSRSTHDPVTDCIVWNGTLSVGGYGQIWFNRGTRVTHRVAYELFAPIPGDLVLDHLCRNRRCINPNHLEPVTVAENNLRGEGFMAVHARKTECPKGHPYDDENTWMKYGARRCRICKSEENRLYRQLQKQRAAEAREASGFADAA